MVARITQSCLASLLKNYPRPPFAPSFFKSGSIRPTDTTPIFHILYTRGVLLMPPRVLASGPKPCGGNKVLNFRKFSLSSPKLRQSLKTSHMTRTFSDGHPKVLSACNFLSQYYFYNIFLQKSCRFSLQTLTKFEAAKTQSRSPEPSISRDQDFRTSGFTAHAWLGLNGV